MVLSEYGAIIGRTISVIQTNVCDCFCWVEFHVDCALVNFTALDKCIDTFAGFFLEDSAEVVFRYKKMSGYCIKRQIFII